MLTVVIAINLMISDQSLKSKMKYCNIINIKFNFIRCVELKCLKKINKKIRFRFISPCGFPHLQRIEACYDPPLIKLTIFTLLLFIITLFY